MDHLPKPKIPLHSPPHIPLYTHEEYDGGPVLEYLDRRRWTTAEIIEGSESGRSREEIHAVLQTWCFFGILTEVLGVGVSLAEFTKRGEDGWLGITTVSLPRLVHEWIDRESVLPHTVRRKDEQHASKCFSEMGLVFTRLVLRDPQFLDKAFYLSLKTLYEYLLNARPLAYGAWDSMEGEWPVTFDFFMPGGESFATDRMEQDGRCVSETTMLCSFLSAQELFFVSNLDRPGPDKSHSGCSETKCIAYQIDQNRYRTRHTEEHCGCDFVFASQGRLSEILLDESGSIPLVPPFNINDLNATRPNVDLIQSKGPQGDVGYVAISHIWSDGLGNASSNAIPTCQFKRLSALVASLFNGTPHPFWLDTLCFPLEPQEAYNLALVRMRESYEKAEKVLVLDSYLLSQDLVEMSSDEVVTRIVSSPWNRRLWTLQERTLARTLVFQFADTFIDLSKEIEESFDKPANLESLIFSNVWNMYTDLRALETREDKVMNVLSAKNACAFRSTSVPSDEPLCLGNLLGVDPAIVVNTLAAERMEIIWDSQKEYFASSIFWLGPKLTKPGYRWAAASLMDGSATSNRTYHGQTPEAYLSDGGLMIQVPGVILSVSKREVDPNFVFCDGSGAWFQVARAQDMTGHRIGRNNGENPAIEMSSNAEPLALLTLEPLKEEGLVGSELNLFAKLALIQEVDDDYIKVKLLYSVQIIKLESEIVENVRRYLETTPDIDETDDSYNDLHYDADDVTPKGQGEEFSDGSTKHIAENTDFDPFQRSAEARKYSQWILKGRRTAIDQIWCVD